MAILFSAPVYAANPFLNTPDDTPVSAKFRGTERLARQSLIANVDVIAAGGEIIASERADGNRPSDSSAGRKTLSPC
jgi:hypothetical protein